MIFNLGFLLLLLLIGFPAQFLAVICTVYYSVIFLSEYVLFIWSLPFLSPVLNLFWYFLESSSLDDFQSWISSSSASRWISRSISGGYLHCLLFPPFFNFQLNYGFIVFFYFFIFYFGCLFPLYFILSLYFVSLFLCSGRLFTPFCLHFLGGKVLSIGSKSPMFKHIYLLNFLRSL